MVFQLFVLEANQDGIENRISFFCTMFSTRMGLSKFWCTYVLYIQRLKWLHDRELYDWKPKNMKPLFEVCLGFIFSLIFSKKSDVHLYRGKKTSLKKGFWLKKCIEFYFVVHYDDVFLRLIIKIENVLQKINIFCVPGSQVWSIRMPKSQYMGDRKHSYFPTWKNILFPRVLQRVKFLVRQLKLWS